MSFFALLYQSDKASLNLIVDIGNSFIKLAVMAADNELVYFKRYSKVLVKDIKALYKKYKFVRSISSSTRKGTPYFLEYLKKHHGHITLSHKTKVPITNKYGTPKTLGLDRLAAVVGAVNCYPKNNVLVIDIGTCMTYDYINKQKQYYGGNIAPGVELRLNAMHHFTSQLTVILTGGDASYFGEIIDSEIFVDSNLVLKGLNDILTYNS